MGSESPPVDTPVLVVGAGAAGLVAALAAVGAGASVLVLERAREGAGADVASNTERSTGLIPAAGTFLQRDAGIVDDSPELLAADILAANGGCDEALVRRVAEAAGATIDWLAGLLGPGALACATDFLYPGHSRLRMHGPRSGYGRQLHQHLAHAAMSAGGSLEWRSGVNIESLEVDRHGRVSGVRLADATKDVIAGAAVVLATNGFGANRDMVRKHLGQGVADGLYLGSPLNSGDAVAWASALGAATHRMDAYQGHATVVAPEGPLVTWGVVVNGGVILDLSGNRFSNELVGYSAFSEAMMRLPGAEAVEVFSERCLVACRGTRLEEVIDAGHVGNFDDEEALCEAHGLPLEAVRQTLAQVREASAAASPADAWGRPWLSSGGDAGDPWAGGGPLHAIRVQAALFHTQGGLRTDSSARVLREADQRPIAGLYAAGGAAAGLSGNGAAGYLSGNGLLHAVVQGRWAGEAAARFAARRPRSAL